MEEGWPRVAEPCGGALWWHDHISDDGEAVAVPEEYAKWRGRRGEDSGAGELAWGGQ